MHTSQQKIVEAAVAQAAYDLYLTCSEAAVARTKAKLLEDSGDALPEADALRRKARRLLMDEV